MWCGVDQSRSAIAKEPRPFGASSPDGSVAGHGPIYRRAELRHITDQCKKDSMSDDTSEKEPEKAVPGSLREEMLEKEQRVEESRRTRTPVPLKEGHPDTKFTRWTKYETWTVLEAAYLVCGIDPMTDYGQKFETYPMVTGLCGSHLNLENNVIAAKRIRELWSRRVDAADRVRPIAFLNWCKANDIDTEWLRELEAPSQPNESDSNQPQTGNAATSGTTTLHLATKEELVEAFGCPKQMFENVHKIAWLKEARKVAGRGGKNSVAPKFDPLLFAESLPGSAYGSHLTTRSAWAKLERHFGDRYAEVSSLDPRK
jgi:hypothetical protein